MSIAFLYSAVGSAAMHFLGAQLAHFSWQGERCAGDFRSELRPGNSASRSGSNGAERAERSEGGKVERGCSENL